MKQVAWYKSKKKCFLGLAVRYYSKGCLSATPSFSLFGLISSFQSKIMKKKFLYQFLIKESNCLSVACHLSATVFTDIEWKSIFIYCESWAEGKPLRRSFIFGRSASPWYERDPLSIFLPLLSFSAVHKVFFDPN